MSKIKFSKSGLSDLTIERGRLFPYSPKKTSVNQERYFTEDYNPKVVDFGNEANFIKLQFRFLSKDNYDGAVNGLRTWFESSTINWSANNFTMTDENGLTHTVRFWDKDFEMPRGKAGTYLLTLTLLKE